MKLLSKPLPNNHNIFLFSDLHDGSVLSSEKAWYKLLDTMHSEYDGCTNNYGYDLGDMMEGISVDDKRFDPEKLTQPLVLEQVDRAIEKRKPIKNMLLGILQGNHERRWKLFGDITQKVCKELSVPYGTYSSKMTILDNKDQLMYKNYLTHGFKSITSTADDPRRRRTNMELILKRQLKFKAGDCAVMVKAHSHKLLVCKPEPELFLTDNGRAITQGYTGWGQNEPFIHPDARWYGSSGSFLKLFGKNISGYAEVFELDPVELGWLVLRVRSKKIISLDRYVVNI